MTRVMLLNIALFLMPFIIFGLWRWLVRGARKRHEFTSDAPVFVLIAIGVGLVTAGLFFFASQENEPVGKKYFPPVIRDGKIVPGHFEQSKTPSDPAETDKHQVTD